MKTWVISAKILSRDWATSPALKAKTDEIEAAGARAVTVAVDEDDGLVDITFQIDANDVDVAITEGDCYWLP